MNIYSNITSNELIDLSLEEYFNYFENNLNKDIDIDLLSKLFTELPYTEKKPYLIRRQLQPKDKRFEKIEIVYDGDKNVGAIVWWFKVTLRELVHLFGKPILHYEPYSESAAFAFKSENPDIEIIKTRYSQSSESMVELKGDELTEFKNIGNQILDIEFSFLQFNLNGQ